MRKRERGFALLMVFLMAAIAAITLYLELPRLAFESQRQKEQMLMERGLQYRRAIQLFLRASNNQRWPANLDELESFNGKRFLRRRYRDPMSGKEEWRLIHIQNGVLTDSITNKQPGKQADSKDNMASQTVGDYGGTVGSYGTPNQGGTLMNAAQRRRASDNNVPGMPGGGAMPAGSPLGGDPTQPGMQVPPTQTAGGQPGQPIQPGQPGYPNGMPGLPGGLPGQVVPGQTIPGQMPTNPAANNNSGSFGTVGNYGSTVGTGGAVGSSPANPSGMPQQYPGMPGPPANSQNFGGVPAYPTNLGANGNPPGYPQPGMQINPNQQSAAANLIGNLLTTPRPGGLQGVQPAGQVMGGGIAGVASTADGDSIMVYRDHTNYSEWEFIFDPTKQKYPPPNPVTGSNGTPAAQLGSMPANNMGTPVSQIANQQQGIGAQPGAMPGMMPGTASGVAPGIITAGSGAMPTGGMGAPNGIGTPNGIGAPNGMGAMGGAQQDPDIRPGRK